MPLFALTAFAAVFVRGHFDQAGLETGQDIHHIPLGGHDRVDILIDHGGFIQAAGEKVHPGFVQSPALAIQHLGQIGADVIGVDARRVDLGGASHLARLNERQRVILEYRVARGGEDVANHAGGLGDDIFGWKAGDVGAPGHSALDTITDFSMKSGAIDGGQGNAMLDLRDLITLGSSESLDDYMNFKQDGDNVVLEVKNAAGGAGEVVQTIVLENAYSSHSIDTNDQDTMNELIKQHIMVNHS